MKEQDNDLTLAYMTGYHKAVEEYRARTCENCKWYDGSHRCNNENSIAYKTDNRVYTYDGCREDWEQKR